MVRDVDDRSQPGFSWRVSLSIIVGIGWLVFVILWLFFYAGEYDGYKTVAILLLSLLLVGLVLGVPWTIWGVRHRSHQEKKMWQTSGFRWRVYLSTVMALVFILFLIYWFWYHAAMYNIFQNIAIFIVAILVAGGVMGASWAPWGMKHGDKFDKYH